MTRWLPESRLGWCALAAGLTLGACRVPDRVFPVHPFGPCGFSDGIPFQANVPLLLDSVPVGQLQCGTFPDGADSCMAVLDRGSAIHGAWIEVDRTFQRAHLILDTTGGPEGPVRLELLGFVQIPSETSLFQNLGELEPDPRIRSRMQMAFDSFELASGRKPSWKEFDAGPPAVLVERTFLSYPQFNLDCPFQRKKPLENPLEEPDDFSLGVGGTFQETCLPYQFASGPARSWSRVPITLPTTSRNGVAFHLLDPCDSSLRHRWGNRYSTLLAVSPLRCNFSGDLCVAMGQMQGLNPLPGPDFLYRGGRVALYFQKKHGNLEWQKSVWEPANPREPWHPWGTESGCNGT